MPRVFISYPHESLKEASQLAKALRARGVDTWYSEENLEPGEDWKTKIQSALRGADVVVFLVTPRSEPSPWLQEEYMGALESYWSGDKKFLVPLLLGKAESPGFLRQWDSLRVVKKSDWDGAADQLVKWLNNGHGPSRKAIKAAKQQLSERLRMITKVAKEL